MLGWTVTMVRHHWLQTFLLVTVAASQFTLDPVDGNFGLTSKHQVLGFVEELILNYTPVSASSSSTSSNSYPFLSLMSSHRQVCDMLKLERRQRRMCKRDSGVAGTLLEAVRISTSECQRLFKYERWNCSIGMYRTKLLREGKGFAETSMLHAISAAGLVHSYAKACSSNYLHSCTCANPKAWKWGGCGDNIKTASRFTRRFLSVRKDRDMQAEVDEHNSRVGIRIVRQNRRKVCKCHGASGSCTFKTCWTRLAPFADTAEQLKHLYERAERVDANDSRLDHSNDLLKGKRGLVYISKSPNFCVQSAFSPGISGRVCNGSAGCDEMCCGRGYTTRIVSVVKPCRCQFIWCCKTICKRCRVDQEIHMCN